MQIENGDEREREREAGDGLFCMTEEHEGFREDRN